jgi:imidazolonepropionase-like amidohydrolase
MRRTLLKTAVALAALTFAAAASAAPTHPKASSSKSPVREIVITGDAGPFTAIVNAHIFTEGALGEVTSGTVLFSRYQIVAIGPDVKIPAGATIIDAHGAIVTPGLVAADAGLAETEVGRDLDAGELGDMTAGPGDGTRDLSTQSAHFTAAFDVQYGLNPASTMLPLARLAGITRAVVTPEYGYGGGRAQPREALFAGQAAAIQLGAGTDLLVKPHVAMVLDLGESGADHAGGSRNAAVLELKEILADVRRYVRDKTAFDRNQARPFAVSKADLEALIPVVEGKMPVLVGVQRASDIRLALQLAKDAHLKVILDGVDEGWLVAPEIAAAHVPVILSPTDDRPESFERLGATMENAARLQAAGVEVIISSASENYRIRELRYLAGDAVAYGLPWKAALAAVTINPAKAFGFADRAGSLEPGKDADLVVWSGDPFEPLSQPIAVFIRGAAQPLTSRSLELRDRYKDLNRPYPPEYH